MVRVLLVLWLLTASVAAAPAKPTTDGRAIVFVVDRALTPVKVEVVRKAVKNASYRDDDDLGVVAFAKTGQTILRLTGGTSRAVVSTTEPTNLVAGLEAAHAMLRTSSRRTRLVIVVTDRDDATDVEPAIAKLRADDITVSAVRVESDNDRVLAAIATAGNGRHYVTRDSTAVGVSIQKEVNRPPPGEETHAEVLLLDRSLYGGPLEIAKEAARQRAGALSPNDIIVVITFDTSATVIVRPQRAVNRMRIAHDISRVTGGDPAKTDVGLQTAFEVLKTIDTTEKRVVVLGTGTGANLDLVREMAAADIVVSAVRVRDREADRAALEAIVAVGNGQLQNATGASLRMR